MIQTSYRANDTDTSSKVEMLNEYWATEAPPCEAFCHPIECDPKENPFSIHYVRSSPVPTQDSPLMYDLGEVFVATSGMPSAHIVGDLWITYEIELLKPVVASSVGGTDYVRIVGITPATGSWFPTAGLITSGNLPVTVSNANVITFAQGLVGSFYVSIGISASTNFTAMDLGLGPTLAPAATVSGFVIAQGGGTYQRTVVSGATAVINRGFYTFGITITDPSVAATATVPAGAWTGTTSQSDLFVSTIV
jgi:hypothetical protein